MSENLRERGSARSQRPSSEAFRKFIAAGWEPRSLETPEQRESAPYAAERRAAISAQFPGERLVIPAGTLKVRSNDTDYRFRPHSAFAHLTGLGTDREPDSVLVIEPEDRKSTRLNSSHVAISYAVFCLKKKKET